MGCNCFQVLVAVHRQEGAAYGPERVSQMSPCPFSCILIIVILFASFCLDLSYLYSKLLTTYGNGVDYNGLNAVGADTEEGELEPLLPTDAIRHSHLDHGVRQFMAM